MPATTKTLSVVRRGRPADVIGLGQAIRVLMGCPFVNGLRARRD
jgi:hypothetical protein